MTRNEKRAKFFKDISFLIVWAHKRHIHLMPIWYHRTTAQQNELYQKGRGLFPDPKKIVTYCDGYKKRSKHQDWLGIDLVVIEKGKIMWVSLKYSIVGKEWTRRGHVWGGNFKGLSDEGHFQA